MKITLNSLSSTFSNNLIEITTILYGLYLLKNQQYLTYLILVCMSMAFVINNVNYKESLLFSVIFLIILTQFHRYFPYREEVGSIPNSTINQTSSQPPKIEGFSKNKNTEQDIKDNEIKKRAKKRHKERKRLEKKIDEAMKKSYSNFSRRYQHNMKKIKKPSENFTDVIDKWSRLKENFYLIFE